MIPTGRLPSCLLGFVFLLVTALSIGPVQQVRAQAGPTLRSVDRPVRVALDPTYQYFESENGRTVTQLSSFLSASVPIGQRFTVQARTGYARMGGDDLKQIRGPTDASARLMYAQPVGEGSIVFSATVNAPVGKQELTEEALQTTQMVSRNFYDFRVSSFSRGLSVSPQVTWAVPVTDRLAVGIGAGYQHQRGFEPSANMGEYVPGDGLGGNAGLDYKLTQGSALGVDVAYKRYGADRLEGNRQFNAGNRISGTVRYLYRSGFTTVRAVARYANWEESEFGYRVGDPDRGQVIPSHGMVLGSYQTRITESIRFAVRLSGHHYAQTVQADQKMFGRLYLSPSFELTEGLVLAPHGTANYGSFAGVGGGLRIEGAF